MKRFGKLLASALALIMCLSIAVPALATEPEELYEQWGFESAEEFMESWFSDLDVTYEELTAQYNAKYEEILADPQIALDYLGYQDTDDMYREAAFWIVESEIWDEYWDSYEEDPGEAVDPADMPLTVQVNGKAVEFPDAQPEITGDRTMAPYRAVAEAMGYEVTWDAGTVGAKSGDRSVTFTIGKTELLITTGSKTETVTMDVAPYIAYERTYVPVRFFAEAFGMDVLWDETTKTAIIYDRDSIISNINKNFLVVNTWLAAVRDKNVTTADGITAADISAEVKLTRFNTIKDNEVTSADGYIAVVSDGKSFRIDGTLDIAGIMKLIPGELTGNENGAALSGEKPSAADKKINIIYNEKEDTLYFCCPMLVRMASELGAFGNLKVKSADNIWISVGGVTESISSLVGTLPETDEIRDITTLGEALVYAAEQLDGSYAAYASAVQASEELARFIGDNCFTKSGKVYTAKLTAAAKEDGTELEQELWADDINDLSVSLTLNTNSGDMSFNITGTQESWDGRLTKISADMSVVGTSGKLLLEYHTNNEMKLEILADINTRKNPSAPTLTPPTGVAVISVDELF